MFVWKGTEQRVCPSTAVEGPGLSPWFGSKHHPAEVSLNQTVSPVQLQRHSEAADGKTNEYKLSKITFSSKTDNRSR